MEARKQGQEGCIRPVLIAIRAAGRRSRAATLALVLEASCRLVNLDPYVAGSRNIRLAPTPHHAVLHPHGWGCALASGALRPQASLSARLPPVTLSSQPATAIGLAKAVQTRSRPHVGAKARGRRRRRQFRAGRRGCRRLCVGAVRGPVLRRRTCGRARRRRLRRETNTLFCGLSAKSATSSLTILILYGEPQQSKGHGRLYTGATCSPAPAPGQLPYAHSPCLSILFSVTSSHSVPHVDRSLAWCMRQPATHTIPLCC